MVALTQLGIDAERPAIAPDYDTSFGDFGKSPRLEAHVMSTVDDLLTHCQIQPDDNQHIGLRFASTVQVRTKQ